MRTLRAQLWLMLHKRGFQVSFTVMLLFAVGCFIEGCLRSSHDASAYYEMAGMQAVHRSFLNETNEQRLQTFEFFFPFIVVLPFSFSLFVDRSTRISEIVLSRCGRGRYYLSKLCAAFIGGFILIFIPLLISCALTHGFCSISVIELFDPNYSTLTAGGKDFLTMRDLLLELLVFSPVLGELFAAALLSVYAGACAVLALAMSCFVNRFSVLIFLPVFLLTKLFALGQSMIIAKYGYTYFNIDPMKYVIISSDGPFYGRPYWLFALEMAAVMSLSAVMMLLASRRDSLG
ncbi:MAG: hypothetical protein IJ555_15305 [Ruminococcus sp.]|nr:hypothetical protein [Ruminococcus sp.]MBR1764738.1 hypothetical protein [Ruminococcus sp.]